MSKFKSRIAVNKHLSKMFMEVKKTTTKKINNNNKKQSEDNI